MTANVYIDGFNLYYCAVKNTRYKWFNVLILTNILFPTITINKIKYFSAKVKALPHDMDAPTRQGIYWRALNTIPNLEIIKGNFVVRSKLFPQYPFAYIFNNKTRPPQNVQVSKTEEKGSDVNLAAYLIYDNCITEADESIVISNDADLVKAIELVTSKLNRPVTIVNPNRTYFAHKYPANHGIQKELERVATRCIRSINEPVLAKSQFPPNLIDASGTFSKPSSW